MFDQFLSQNPFNIYTEQQRLGCFFPYQRTNKNKVLKRNIAKMEKLLKSKLWKKNRKFQNKKTRPLHSQPISGPEVLR